MGEQLEREVMIFVTRQQQHSARRSLFRSRLVCIQSTCRLSREENLVGKRPLSRPAEDQIEEVRASLLHVCDIWGDPRLEFISDYYKVLEVLSDIAFEGDTTNYQSLLVIKDADGYITHIWGLEGTVPWEWALLDVLLES